MSQSLLVKMDVLKPRTHALPLASLKKTPNKICFFNQVNMVLHACCPSDRVLQLNNWSAVGMQFTF